MSADKFPAKDDLKRAFENWSVVSFMALSDMRARYKRSVLGPLWITLGTAIGSVGLGMLWSELLKVDAKSFVPTLTAGLIIWQLVSGVITESCGLYGRQASIIRNMNLPLSIHPLQLIFRHLVNFAHNIPVFIVLALILNVPFNLNTLLFIPGLLLVSLNLLWICLVVSLLGARFRDLEHIVGTVIPLLMFVSPVFYRPAYLPFSQNIIWANPLSYFIEIIRDPLLGVAPPMFVIQTNLLMLVVGWIGAVWLFNKKHNRIAFWV
ncbi:ABC transporter permease [Pantoea sp. 18069]|uniref:ABC transporter permease n=1 Tax=Pantoea sp. 18069 TaxID=2681415 RepID=UPI00135C88CA|nr:ABC transporter permease [Pantoea sp. 18069]